MSIIGCDLHSRYQVVAGVNTEDGEVVTRGVGSLGPVNLVWYPTKVAGKGAEHVDYRM
jgi:hypothetical protein